MSGISGAEGTCWKFAQLFFKDTASISDFNVMFENYFSVFLSLLLMCLYFDMICKSTYFFLLYGSSMCPLCQGETSNH